MYLFYRDWPLPVLAYVSFSFFNLAPHKSTKPFITELLKCFKFNSLPCTQGVNLSIVYYFKNDSGNRETLHLNSVMPFLGIKGLLHGNHRWQQPHLKTSYPTDGCLPQITVF